MNKRSTLPQYYESRFKPSAERALVWKIFAQHLQNKFSIKGKVLDAGTGYGDFINNICVEKRFAMDLNENSKAHLDSNVIFQAGGLENLEQVFPGEKFDTIFSSNVLEHLTRSEIDLFLKGSWNSLVSGGKLVVFMPNYKRAYKEYFDDYTHQTALSEVSLCDWMQAHGFSIQFCHPGYMPFSVKNSRVPIFSLAVRMWLWSPWKPGKQMLVVGRKA